MSALNLYRGIDSAAIRPFAAEAGRNEAFTTVKLFTDGMEVTWMISTADLPALTQRLRDVADAIESGQSVTLDKGWRGEDGKWVAMASPLIVNGTAFPKGYTVRAAAYEAMR